MLTDRIRDLTLAGQKGDRSNLRKRPEGCFAQIGPVPSPQSRCAFVKEMRLATVLVKDLIEAGVHFGHRASRWNPKMRPYIYARRNLIHIIDVRETIRGLLRTRRYLQKVCRPGKPGADGGHEAASVRRDRAAGPSLWHALRQRPLAGRHAHQLSHHPQPADAARRTGGHPHLRRDFGLLEEDAVGASIANTARCIATSTAFAP